MSIYKIKADGSSKPKQICKNGRLGFMKNNRLYYGHSGLCSMKLDGTDKKRHMRVKDDANGKVFYYKGNYYYSVFPYLTESYSVDSKFKHKKNSIDFIKIPDENMKDEFGAYITIGGINLNNMIPVNDTVIQPVDIAIHSSDNKKQRNNKKRLTKELDWCQRNQDLITRKARKLYDLRLNHSMENINLTRRCCDFKKLEAVLERRLAKAQSNEYEPKEKAVAASAEIPVRHPAIIRRRKNTGRSC